LDGRVDTVNDLLAQAVGRFGRRPALLIRPGFRTRTWRYRDLGTTVPRIGAALRAAGLKPGDRALIWAVNRPEWGLAFLGAIHAGIVLVPLDVRSSGEFAVRVADRTRASAVIASNQTRDLARQLGLPVILIETLPDRARRSKPIGPHPAGPDDLVEIVFTSGTTGEPKGAMLTHRNLASNAQSLATVFPFGRNERLLSILPLSHMFEQTCGFLTPLLAGASVVYPVSRQPSVLIRTFKDFKVTMLLIVPQGLKLLDNAIERKVDQGGRRATFERLHHWAARVPRRVKRILFRPVLSTFGGRFRTVAVGGAAMDPDLAHRWTDMGLDVLQGYGATEMAPCVCFTHPERNRIGTVGEALPGVEMRVAPDGEVIVRGPNRFAGYWEDPERTAEVIDADGWYHTGDLGEISADGFLTLRGRKKDMLAMPDGSKVYPEDIENVLSHDDRLTDAAVVGFPPTGEVKIHAVLLLAEGTDTSAIEAVIRDANAKLGAHQQIRSWSVWPEDDFPRTHTLKVKKLQVLERLETDGSGGSAPAKVEPGRAAAVVAVPAGTLGQLIPLVASISGLDLAVVTADARLSSDLNMDSLQRVELLGVIEEELGTYVDDAALDPEATVAALAGIVDASRDAKRETGIYGWPLSPAVRAFGLAFQELLTVPFLALFYRIRIRGERHLRGLEGPVIFTPNHCLHFDNAIILSSLPFVWRWRLSVAAAADDVFGNPFRALAVSVLGNAFPIAREGAIRRSLELMGARMDRNFNVLIYPEGKLTVGGPTQPFLAGAGLIAVEGGTPVVPMKLNIHQMSRIDAPGNPWRGDVEVVFGEPMWFDSDTSPTDATARLEAAVAAL
jgi:long-chain acyl-CoA synthetase